MKTMDAMNSFLLSRQAKGLSPETIRWYRGILGVFAKQYTRLPRAPDDIDTFLISIKAKDERRHGYYRTLRAFYRFLRRRYKITNPMDLVDAPKRKPKNPRALTPEMLERLFRYDHKPKIKAALMFLIDSGARVGELAGLTIQNMFETPWGYIATIRGKTGERQVPITYESYHSLMVNLPLGYSLYRLRRLISKAFTDAGVTGTAHTLRHTFGTLWEGDELVLQQIMGHAHLSTTKIYRHLRVRMICQQHQKYTPLSMVPKLFEGE